jgi:hypothetical protein
MATGKTTRRGRARKAGTPGLGLHIKPHGGEFAVWDGDEWGNLFSTRAEAERALALWRADVAAGKAINWYAHTGSVTDEATGEDVFDARSAVTKNARDGGLERQRRRREDEDDEPKWVAEGVRIAKAMRETDPFVTSKSIAERIGETCEHLHCPGFDMLMKHIRRWEAAERIPRKAKAQRFRKRPGA